MNLLYSQINNIYPLKNYNQHKKSRESHSVKYEILFIWRSCTDSEEAKILGSAGGYTKVSWETRPSSAVQL